MFKWLNFLTILIYFGINASETNFDEKSAQDYLDNTSKAINDLYASGTSSIKNINWLDLYLEVAKKINEPSFPEHLKEKGKVLLTTISKGMQFSQLNPQEQMEKIKRDIENIEKLSKKRPNGEISTSAEGSTQAAEAASVQPPKKRMTVFSGTPYQRF